MDNRDRDKLNKNRDRSSQPDIGKSKSDLSADFGKNIGRSEEITSEPSRRVPEGSGMKSSGKDRSSNLDSDVSSSSSSGSKGSQDVSGDLGRGSQGGSRH